MTTNENKASAFDNLASYLKTGVQKHLRRITLTLVALASLGLSPYVRAQERGEAAQAVAQRLENTGHLTQLVTVTRDGKLVTLPRNTEPDNRTRIVRVAPGDHLDPLERLRTKFGGELPYNVVKTKQPFVMVSEDDDILIVGLRNLEKEVLSQHREGDHELTQNPRQTTIVEGDVKVSPQLPGYMPANVLTTSKDYTAKEITFEPNRRLCHSTGEYVEFQGERLHVLRLPLREHVLRYQREQARERDAREQNNMQSQAPRVR